MKIIRKLFLPLLCVICLSLTACQSVDGHLKKTVSGLITKGLALHKVYNDDFPTQGQPYTINGSKYLKLSEIGKFDGLDFSKIHTIEELKALTETVYTKEYATDIFYGPHITVYSTGSPKFIEYEGDVYIDVARIGITTGIPHWDTRKMVKISKTDDTLTIGMHGWFEFKDGMKISDKQWKLRIRSVGGEWRLESLVQDGSIGLPLVWK